MLRGQRLGPGAAGTLKNGAGPPGAELPEGPDRPREREIYLRGVGQLRRRTAAGVRLRELRLLPVPGRALRFVSDLRAVLLLLSAQRLLLQRFEQRLAADVTSFLLAVQRLDINLWYLASLADSLQVKLEIFGVDLHVTVVLHLVSSMKIHFRVIIENL